YKDWDTANQRGADYSYESVIDNLHNGAIILMHSVSQSNREALGKIIDEIRNQGFTFKTVDEL
ncbi:MAG TPA: polysaccharide deacetylase, partial [Bacilli bacterium]|nr:polysaccharide deacetylase [Bacilli bacterium]